MRSLIIRSLLSIVLFLIVSCTSWSGCKSINDENCSLGFDYRGETLNHLVGTNKFLHIRDTTIQSEGYSWPAVIISIHSDSIKANVLLETSWNDTVNVSRVNVISGTLFLNGYKITLGDSKVKSLDGLFLDEVPNAPDGYFFLRDRFCEDVEYWITSLNSSTLLEGRINRISDIPEDATIDRITIVNQRGNG